VTQKRGKGTAEKTRPRKAPPKKTRKAKARGHGKVQTPKLRLAAKKRAAAAKRRAWNLAHPRVKGRFVARKRRSPRPRPKRAAKPQAPKLEVVEWRGVPDAGHWREPRVFRHGAQLLGYLEGRPGVIAPLSARPVYSGEARRAPDAAEKAEALTRIRESDALTGLELSGPERRQLESDWLDAWEMADDGGAYVEVEVDSDSGGNA